MAALDEHAYLEEALERGVTDAGKEANGNGKEARNAEDVQKSDGASKRSKEGEREHGRDREGRDRERDKDKEKDRDGRRDKDKDRERDGHKDHRERDRDRDRDRDSNRDREVRRSSRDDKREGKDDKAVRDERRPDRDRDRERSRSDRDRPREERHPRDAKPRSRSPSRPHHRSRSRERNRSRSKERSRKRAEEEEKERLLRESQDPILMAQREREREMEELERMCKTVYAYNLNTKADERDLFEFFSQAGKVMDVRLIMDRNSRRSKGLAYIEYAEKESVPLAIALSGQMFMNQPVMVKPSEAEKNVVAAASAAMPSGLGAFGFASGGPVKLFVGNLHLNLTEADLQGVFDPFGTIDFIQLAIDNDTRRSKGYAYVQYQNASDAQQAIQQLNGMELAGKQMKVAVHTETSNMSGINLGELDDDEGGGLALNAQSRAALMAKLSGQAVPGVPTLPGALPSWMPGAMAAAPAAARPQQPATPPTATASPVPTNCILLKNMFDPTQETEPEWHLDIQDDVRDECSKYGKVKHCFVDKNTQGYVWMKFETAASAIQAKQALDGRWFAGRQITVEFQNTTAYASKFSDS
eukprot:jgi/Chlat1/762/Chrsp104S01237